MKPALLIVDDDDEIRTQMRWALADEYEIIQAENRDNAVIAFNERRPAVVLLDLGLPPYPNSPEEGLATLSELHAIDPLAKIVIISGQGEKDNTLQAIGNGAYDFLNKPVEMDDLKLLLKRCFHVSLLEHEYHKIKHTLMGDSFEGMIGTSKPMQAAFDTIRKVATTDAPIMILGESGTGKEMAAQAIHNSSSRKNGPFIAINCSAIPETLLESELFGHEKGSFTGAQAQRKGKIEQAEGGTLFLDEIGDVPLQVQVKLLRFLQERYIERIGGAEIVNVDTRVIAATNANLQDGMKDGTFREDFYYRLAVVELSLPALRDRNGDIELLAQSLLQSYASDNGKAGLSFSKKSIDAIKSHSWPGNVRELQNRIRRAVILSDAKRITPQDLELQANTITRASRTLKEAREELEREMVEGALQKHNGKITAAATELGISRPTFYELMDKLDIERKK